MKTSQHRVSGLKTLPVAWLAIAIAMTGYASTVAAHNDGAVWGIGGLLAGSMLTKAYTSHKQESQPTHTHYTAPPAPTSMTPEQKIQQLNALAAGGYITPQEYKTEKQPILNSIVE